MSARSQNARADIQEIFRKGADFSSRLLAKVPKGTTQFIVTLSWQGDGSIKRLAVSVTALSSDENWCVVLEFDDVEDYRIIVEVQR